MARIKSKKYAGVYLNKLRNKDISYSINYKDINNKLQWLKIGKQSEGITQDFCNQKRIEILSNIRLGEEPTKIRKKRKKNIITLDELTEKYFVYVKHKKDYKNSLSRYNNHIKPNFGNRDIGSITKKNIEALQKEKQKKLSNKTVNHIIQLFSTIINYNIKEEGLKTTNPALGVKLLELDNTRTRYLSTQEIQKLLKHIEDDEILTLFVKLSLSTGGRVHSIVSIKTKDINFNENTINLKDYKNKSTYTGFLNDSLVEILRNVTKYLKPNDLIISKSADNIQKKLKVIFDELFNKDLDKSDAKNRVVVHSLRHTFASHLVSNGTSIYTVQRLMNHKDIRMTMRYAKLAKDSGKTEVQGLYQ
jgi:site-specific recombinase XerD